MKQVLVTGGAGLIGAALCEKLLEQNQKVVCVDNFITSNKDNIKHLLGNTNFRLLEHDITIFFPKAIIDSKIDEIYHLACPTGVPNLSKLSMEMLRTCSVGTENVLELARKNKAKFVFTSSSEVYGDPLVFPQTEDYTGNVDSVGVRSPYEEGKRYAESLVISYVRKFSVDAKIVRLFNTYGPKKYDDTRVITKFINNAKSNKAILIEGTGDQSRTFCFVTDIINALLIINDKGNKGEVYNAGSDNEITILELANLVKIATNSKSKIRFIKRPAHDHSSRLPDLIKLRKLGWNQAVGIYEGLKKL